MKKMTLGEDSIQAGKDAMLVEQLERALQALRDSKATMSPPIVAIPQQTSEKWMPPKNVIKILLLGEGGRGSTTVLYKYIRGSFIADTSMTIGVQIHSKNITFDGQPYSLIFWDFAGQDRCRFLLPAYARGARGAIMMYDTTRMASLDCSEEWVGIARTYDKDLPVLLCGTKIDLEAERGVASDYAKTFLQPLGMFDYIEVSAKTGENVDKLFETLVRKILGPGVIKAVPIPLPVPLNEPAKQVEIAVPPREGIWSKIIHAGIINGPALSIGGRERAMEKTPTTKKAAKKAKKPSKVPPKTSPKPPVVVPASTPRTGPKLKEMFQKIRLVSTRIEMERVRQMLKLSPEEFNVGLIDWAVEFGFKIDGPFIIFQEPDRKEDFKPIPKVSALTQRKCLEKPKPASKSIVNPTETEIEEIIASKFSLLKHGKFIRDKTWFAFRGDIPRNAPREIKIRLGELEKDDEITFEEFKQQCTIFPSLSDSFSRMTYFIIKTGKIRDDILKAIAEVAEIWKILFHNTISTESLRICERQATNLGKFEIWIKIYKQELWAGFAIDNEDRIIEILSEMAKLKTNSPKEKFAKFAEKIKKLNDAPANVEEFLEATLHIGIKHADDEETVAAICIYEDIVKIDPTYASAWKWMGVEKNKLGDSSGASFAFGQYVRVAPSDASFDFTTMDWSEFKDIMDFERVIPRLPELQMMKLMGAKHAINHEWEKARDVFKNAIMKDPDWAVKVLLANYHKGW